MSFLQWALIIVATALPVVGWFSVFFNQNKENKKVLSLIFFLGCLTAPTFLLIQYLWQLQTGVSLGETVQQYISSFAFFIIVNIFLFAILEEIIKFYVVKIVDNKTLLINKINDAIRYSIIAALGFAFIENIYYLSNLWGAIPTSELIATYIFRSIFTMCGHIIYSGIFGYHYAMGKFAIIINQQQSLIHQPGFFQKLIANLFRLPMSESFRQKMILKGLLLATLMHSFQNYLLEYGHILLTVAFIVSGYFYLHYLLNRKASHLVLTEDISKQTTSSLAHKDEDVVIELLGLWFNEKKFVDVIHVCERLLERDPDNNVVKLFKARALDRMDDNHTYKNILGKILKTSDQLDNADQSRLSKYLEEKAALAKIKAQIRIIVEKEGRTFQDPDKIPKAAAPTVQPPKAESETYKLS